MKISYILIAIIMAVLLVALLACNSKRMLAERRLAQAETNWTAVGWALGYGDGTFVGINAAINTVKVNGTNKPSIDIAEALEYARTNMASRVKALR